MFGIDHVSSFPLLVHRVCEGFQHCIRPANIKLVMHSNSSCEHSQRNMNVAREFLNAVGVDVTVDQGLFTSNNKMMVSLLHLSDLPIPPVVRIPAISTTNASSMRTGIRYGNGLEGIIYHSDLDEVPEPSAFYKALEEMQRGECDAIRGQWVERVSESGQPQAVTLGDISLRKQYPYRCNISSQYMPLRTTVKVLAYRPNYRLVSGQHDVWCNFPREVAKGEQWDQGVACRAHLRLRQDKSTPIYDIFKLLPKPGLPPRFCSTHVPIDHYKFVPGVMESLTARVNTYKRLNFVWWKQSNELLLLLDRGNGGINVSSSQFNCVLD